MNKTQDIDINNSNIRHKNDYIMYFSGSWWRNYDKFYIAIHLYGSNKNICKKLSCNHSLISKWSKRHNLKCKRLPSKRFCIKGHDTWYFGRNKKRQCKECKRDVERIKNMTPEKIKIKNEKEFNRQKNRTIEQKQRDREIAIIRYEQNMKDPIYRMKEQTRRRIQRNERKLNGYRI